MKFNTICVKFDSKIKKTLILDLKVFV